MPAKQDKYEEGDRLQWNWGGSTATGTVQKVYTRKVTRTIDGSEITREASDDEPAYLLEQEDGSEVLKSHSEVKKA